MTDASLPLNPFDPGATDQQLFKSVQEALAAIPPGHSHAILLDGLWSQKTGQPSAWVSFLQKMPDGWNVVADGGYDQPHGAFGSVQLAKSW